LTEEDHVKELEDVAVKREVAVEEQESKRSAKESGKEEKAQE